MAVVGHATLNWEKIMTKKELREKYQALQHAGKLSGTIARAMRLRAEREANPPRPEAEAGRIAAKAALGRARRGRRVAVPLGSRSFASDYRAQFPRLREWSLGEIATTSSETFATKEIGSNSDWNKRSTFQRGVLVQSYATCRDFREAVLVIAGKEHRIKAPRGYRWDVDKNGLLLRAKSDRRADYHPTATELLGPVAAIVATLKENFATRKAARAKEAQRLAAIRRAETEGATVCLRDSVRAGNCLAGSLTWAQRHGLDPSRHYRPSEVLSLANGDAHRVALVVTLALKRHREEMERGFAVLADHQV